MSRSPSLSMLAMTSDATSSVWPVLHYDDTRIALRFLVDVLGFRAMTTAADAEGDIVHAEVSWPGGGALVFGGTRHAGGVHGGMRPGAAAVYVVTDEVDAVHRRAAGAGADVVEPPRQTRFGSGARSYAMTVRDPEGNLWTFGTYRGAALQAGGQSGPAAEGTQP